ncbi:ribosome recycling factor [Balneola vulgaris]|jgi:ribosome recycling factor|uniref:ribosome recycling factor n=1 Tax=Balneola vulgaris TaxID=287535 RepID=UPI0003658A77|nr:ribosome recycling factor [Balneola vulgaris]
MIPEELQEIIDEADIKMEDAVAYLKKEFSHIRAGKANPALIEGVKVEYYGSQTPLQQLANISVPEPRLLMVSPYDKSALADIEKAIMAAGLGLNPMNDGDFIRIPLPILTEERRKELVKLSKDKAEQARISIRNSRRDANDEIKKKVEADSLPEDSKFEAEDEVQKITDKNIALVEETLSKKEEEIMTV